jgi:hypothetical protein
MVYVVGYLGIAILLALVNSYRKGCAVKKSGGWFDYQAKEGWDVLIVFGSLIWPILALYVVLMPFKYICTLPYKLGLKYGCPRKK